MEAHPTRRRRERPHPGVREYIMIAVALGVVTLIEVGVYYVEFLRPVLVPMLLVLSAIKFALVVLWFMHLRFDSRLYSRLFLVGLLLAISLYVVVLVTFGVLIG